MSYSEKDLVQEESKEIMRNNWVEVRPGMWLKKISEEPIEELDEGRPLPLPLSSNGTRSDIFLNIAKFMMKKNRFKYLRWVFLILALWSCFMVGLRIYSERFGVFFYLEIFNLINFYNFHWMNKAYKENLNLE